MKNLNLYIMKQNIFNAVDSADKDSIAIEALIMAETQYMTGDYDESELVDQDNSPEFMTFKDDEGFWRICDEHGTWINKFDSYEELEENIDKIKSVYYEK